MPAKPQLINGVVVRAFVSQQCGLGSIPRVNVVCGVSLLVLYFAARGFSLGAPVFPSPQNPTFDLILSQFVHFSLQCLLLELQP